MKNSKVTCLKSFNTSNSCFKNDVICDSVHKLHASYFYRHLGDSKTENDLDLSADTLAK